jgi:hypothetical protein
MASGFGGVVMDVGTILVWLVWHAGPKCMQRPSTLLW